jgi:hypothetical protein
MPENTLKITSKTAQNGVKTPFSSFPDPQNLFLDQKSRGRFFHPDGPVFDPFLRFIVAS